MQRIAITGAQSYTGRYVCQKLLAKNCDIVNLSNHPEREWKINSSRIVNAPLKFVPQDLIQSLTGCSTLVQTYWVRFDNTLGITREQVTDNSKMLIDCAKKAGVKQIIYTSHTQTSLNSPIDYIRQKAKVEQHLRQSGLNYGIVKPCAIFGRTPHQSIMINNISYLIKRFLIFPMPGDGNYVFQFVHVEDMADLIIKCVESKVNVEVDAVGPERVTFKQIITESAKIFNTTCYPITGVNKKLTHLLTMPLNWAFNDILMDKNDLELMMSGLTCSLEAPTGKKSLLKWIAEHKESLGKDYVSSITRYYK